MNWLIEICGLTAQGHSRRKIEVEAETMVQAEEEARTQAQAEGMRYPRAIMALPRRGASKQQFPEIKSLASMMGFK